MPQGRGGVDGAYVEHEPSLRYLGCNDAKHGSGKGNAGTEVWTVLSSGAFGKAHKVAQEQLDPNPLTLSLSLSRTLTRWRRSSSRARRRRRR